MVRKAEKEILTKEYISNLRKACILYILNDMKDQKKVYNYKHLNFPMYILIQEVWLVLFHKKSHLLGEYVKSAPSVQTIKRSLNRVSPKENGCSKALKSWYDGIMGFNLKKNKTKSIEEVKIKSQILIWAVNFGGKPGAIIDELGGRFISWKTLKSELEKQVINSIPGVIQIPARVELSDHYEKKDWIIKIIDKNGSHVGDVWIGSNPENSWRMDGKIRIGRTISDKEWKVWQVYERFSDGSYRVLRSI